MDSTQVISDILDNSNFDINLFNDLMLMAQEFESQELMRELNS
jgi:hypothetical protein